MKLNTAKTKFMLLNPTKKFDFVPQLKIGNKEVETLEEMTLLGLIISNDLSWKQNTANMISKAYKKLWMIKRLQNNGANIEDLTDIYIKQTLVPTKQLCWLKYKNSQG